MQWPNLTPKTVIKIIAGSLAVILIGWFLIAFDVPPQPRSKETFKVHIPDGTSVSGIADTLKSRGLIRNEFLFRLYVAMTGQERVLQSGTYIISPADSMQRIAYLMSQGLSESDDVTVTIPEGFNVWEIDRRLFEAGLTVSGQFAQLYRFKEGRLFPDTYRFEKDATPEEIVIKMETNFLAKTRESLPNQQISNNLITIASILEKEAHTPQDMAIISGVIQKRTSIGMALQMDATVGYGWCVKQSQIIPRYCDTTQAPIAKEIKIDGPYNTYSRRGLPAGPIANPGVTALRAAVNPQKTDYLYYLSTRDGSQIIYSKTGAEHAANRKKYLGL